MAKAKRLVAETDADEMTALPDDYAYLEVSSDYGGIPQRWLVVHSPVAAQREEKTLLHRVTKEEKTAQTAWRKLTSQTFNCLEDAETAREEIQKRWNFHQVEAEVVPQTRYPRPGRPAAGATPDVIGYQLQGVVRPSKAALENARTSLATSFWPLMSPLLKSSPRKRCFPNTKPRLSRSSAASAS